MRVRGNRSRSQRKVRGVQASMLTRKHYRVIAKILHENKSDKTMDTMTQFAMWLQSDNPRFDTKKFYEAVLTGKGVK